MMESEREQRKSQGSNEEERGTEETAKQCRSVEGKDRSGVIREVTTLISTSFPFVRRLVEVGGWMLWQTLAATLTQINSWRR